MTKNEKVNVNTEIEFMIRIKSWRVLFVLLKHGYLLHSWFQICAQETQLSSICREHPILLHEVDGRILQLQDSVHPRKNLAR